MSFWHGRRVLITGHTGFKGGWLSLYLHNLGADICGYALTPPTTPSLYSEAALAKCMRSEIADIRQLDRLKSTVLSHKPEVVFHLAAQPLVRESYIDPIGTYEVNVLGTANVLEAVRGCDSVRSVVVITTDKCYENQEWIWPYREADRLGGYDPYSNSKACAELVVSSYRNSFFHPEDYSKHGVAIATVRAGNVIGGGDWAKDRLIPDIIRAFSVNEKLFIRNPEAVRPWQHVLEPLSGYVKLAERLVTDNIRYGEAWNFGPEYSDAKPVKWIVKKLAESWGDNARWKIDEGNHPHEAQMLKLDWSKAASKLGWQPTLHLEDALHLIVEWYRRHAQGEDAYAITLEQLKQFMDQATLKHS